MKTDVAIIGSGISSLVSGILLAQSGRSVHIFEQYSKVGGYMHCFNRFGRRFDTGAHYVGALGEGDPFHTLLTQLGVYDPSLFVELDRDGFDVFSFPQMKIAFPVGYPKLQERLTEKFPEERDGIREYLKKLKETPNLFQTYNYTTIDVDLPELIRRLEVPLSRVISDCVKNPLLQTILSAYCALHGVHPDETPFGMHAVTTDSLLRGAYGLAGGGDALAQKMASKLRELGGEITCKKQVTRILVDGKQVRGVAISGGKDGDKEEIIEAKCVISSAHPKATFSILSDDKAIPPAFKSRLGAVKESVGLLGIYALVKSSSHINPLRNYYYFSTPDLREVFVAQSLGEKPRGAFLSPAERERPLDSQGSVAINVHAVAENHWFKEWQSTQFGKRPESYHAFKQVLAEDTFDLIDEHEPGFRERVERFATSSPLTNLHFNGSPEGSAYGLYHSIQNTGARSFGPRTKISNLFLTGQSTLFPGLLGAAISGLRTADRIAGNNLFLNQLRERVS